MDTLLSDRPSKSTHSSKKLRAAGAQRHQRSQKVQKQQQATSSSTLPLHESSFRFRFAHKRLRRTQHHLPRKHAHKLPIPTQAQQYQDSPKFITSPGRIQVTRPAAQNLLRGRVIGPNTRTPRSKTAQPEQIPEIAPTQRRSQNAKM